MGSVDSVNSSRVALLLEIAHFVGMVCVLCIYTRKPFIFTHTVSVSYQDAVLSFNHSNMTLFFQDMQQSKGLDSLHSIISVSVVNPFILFMTGSSLALFYAFTTIRVVESGQINCDTQYGEHGVVETMGWESMFWVYVAVQHAIVLTVMSSPGDMIYIVFQSAAVMILLCLFCCLGANIAADNPVKRFEAPVLILLCMCYVLFLSNSKVVISLHATYVIWMTYLTLDGLLVIGHTWDFPVACHTVMNCRWAYTVLCGWANVVLYVVL